MKGATPVEPVVLRWTRRPQCVGRARAELRNTLCAWGLLALEDAAVLVLSELLTNAGRHAHVAGREIETRFLPLAGGGVRIEVHDASPVLPVERAPDLDLDQGLEACGGRGLFLVAALAVRWGYGERSGPGKVVWAECGPGDRPHE